MAFGLALAAGGYLMAAHAADRGIAAQSRPAALAAGVEAFTPLDEVPPVSGTRPILVLSVTCPACLDLLTALMNTTWPVGKIGPAIYVKSAPKDRALAVAWLSACAETDGSSARDRFMAVTAMLVAQKDLVVSDPGAAAVWLTGIFHPSEAARRAAEAQVETHAALLAAAGVKGTPTLWPVEGAARAKLVPADLWR